MSALPSPETLAAVGLVVETTGPVLTVTLHRPEVRNAQTPAMWRALAQIGESVGDEVRVVVLRGSGHSFSAGLDRSMLDPSAAGGETETVADLLRGSDEEMSAAIDDYQRGFTWLRDPRFVSIAAVQGYAIGAGFQLALSCDLRVLADDAQLSMKESALGLVPDLSLQRRRNRDEHLDREPRPRSDRRACRGGAAPASRPPARSRAPADPASRARRVAGPHRPRPRALSA